MITVPNPHPGVQPRSFSDNLLAAMVTARAGGLDCSSLAAIVGSTYRRVQVATNPVKNDDLKYSGEARADVLRAYW
ncbi:MAG TPA: hypothetical protein ENK28_04910 [Aliiroseovarius sp.]|nr:hypothetical protein [Aliiroseovarius sp.]